MLTLVCRRTRDREAAEEVARLVGVRRGDVHQIELAELISRIRSDKPDLVVVCDGAGDPGLAKLIASLAGTAGEAYFVLVAPTIDPDTYRTLLRSGRADWVRPLALATELGEVLERLAVPATRRAGSGKIVSFLPVAGGVGNTTLAMETAIHAATGKGSEKKRICVLDLNIQYSALPDYFDVSPRFDVASIIDDPSRLDEHLLELLTSSHGSGVDVICAAPSTLDPGRLDGDVVFGLLDAIVQRYDFVHVDLPPIWFPWMENLLSGSDSIVVTGTFDVPSIKRISVALKRITTATSKSGHTAVAINRCDNRLFGSSLKRSDVEQSLAGQMIFMLPLDADAAVESINTGTSLVQSGRSRKLSQEIGRLAAWVGGARERDTSRKSWSWKLVGG